MTADRETLSWEDFGRASRELAQQVVDSGYEVEVVVAIARGGMLLAGSVSYALGVKNCGALNVEFYTGVGTRLPEPVILPPLLDQAALDGRRILLVDDVSDSGRTLAMVIQLLEASGVEVRTAVLYTKPNTVQEADYSWGRTDRWINFPWSVQPPVVASA